MKRESKKFKFNWGHGLALALILFALSMGYAVYLAVTQKYDLVTDDYYAQELRYQERIDQKQNALRLGEPLGLAYKRDELLLQMPRELHGQKAELILEMYCVTNAQNDFSLSQENWTVSDFALPGERLPTGRWTAKLTLHTAETSYYFDPQISIP